MQRIKKQDSVELVKRANTHKVHLSKHQTFIALECLGPACALVGGFVNVVMAIRTGLLPGNVTGHVTFLGEVLVAQNASIQGFAAKNETWESWSIYILGTILCYIAGAAFTGFLIGHQSFTLSGNLPYDFVLAAEFLLLLVTSLEEYFESERQAIFPAAVALGLQNALTTSFSGAIVRTTHLTGTSSDIGMFLGRIGWRAVTGKQLRGEGERNDIAKLRLLCLLWAGFFAGALIGAWWAKAVWVDTNPWFSLLPAEVFILVLMLAYFTFRVIVLHRHFFPPTETARAAGLLRNDGNGEATVATEGESSNHPSAFAENEAAATSMAETKAQFVDDTKDGSLFGREGSFQGGSFHFERSNIRERHRSSRSGGVELTSGAACDAIREEEKEGVDSEGSGFASEGGGESSASLSPVAGKRGGGKNGDVEAVGGAENAV